MTCKAAYITSLFLIVLQLAKREHVRFEVFMTVKVTVLSLVVMLC
jgi:hypothetical protein